MRSNWRAGCNRSCGTPMRVDSILLPATAQAAPSGTQPLLSPAPSSFSATLASSMSTSKSEPADKGTSLESGLSKSKTHTNTESQTNPTSRNLSSKSAVKPGGTIDATPEPPSAKAPKVRPDPAAISVASSAIQVAAQVVAQVVMTAQTAALANLNVVPAIAVLPTNDSAASTAPSQLATPLAEALPAPVSSLRVLPALTAADSKVQASILNGETIIAPNQSSRVESPSAPGAPIAAAMVASGTALANADSSNLSNDCSLRPVESPSGVQNQTASTNPVPEMLTAISPAEDQTPPQPAVVGVNNYVSLAAASIANLPVAPETNDVKASVSPTGNSASVDSAAKRAWSASADLNTIAPQALSSDTITAPEGMAYASTNGMAPANNLARNIADNTGTSDTTSITSNPASNLISNRSSTITSTPTSALTMSSTTLDPTPASLATAASDAPGKPRLGGTAQPATTATSQASAADKKSAVLQTNVVLSLGGAPPGVSSPNGSLQNIPAALVAGKDPSATLTPPGPTVLAFPTQDRSNSAPELPQTHLMLDSAPPAPPAVPPIPIVPDSAAELQMNAQINAQMHVGIRTDAFGAVEIHTVIQQSQVGITVHADRDLARWFTSEVPGLESGLNQHHLNLTAVEFDNGRSGFGSGTGSQQGQARQGFSPAPSPQSATPAEQVKTSEPAAISILSSDPSVGSAQHHVSIHV
jgi:hypothetical protein